MIAVPAEDPEMLYYIVVVNDEDQIINDVVPEMTNEFFNNSIDILSYKDEEKTQVDDNKFLVQDYLGKDISQVQTDLIENSVDVMVVGSGEIVDQYPLKGSVMSKDQKIILRADDVSSESDLEGLAFEDAKALCNANDWDCTYSGYGNVVSYKKESDSKYYIEFKPPYKE
jgi:beta-lactam-binding protein with PASTA domain